MCGIAGIVNPDGAPVDPGLLKRMSDAIRHRGPDEEGFYRHAGVGLAVRRLAVIDLQTGGQPIHSADGTRWIVFNGEIYNYRELRERLERQGYVFSTASDTEAILHAYEEYGTDCPTHLRGMFAFAVWDERERSLFLARDRVGKKPLLYASSKGRLIFGSEFQALLQHPSIGRAVDFEAIHHYLSFLCVPAPLTAFREIRKLEPGHWLLWRGGQIRTERYWHLDFSNKLAIGEDEAGDRLLHLLRDAVRVRMHADVPVGAFLSGGVDSSAVVALMAQEASGPIKTFSIGFEEEEFSELPHARRMAEAAGVDHHEFIVRPDAASLVPTLVEHYGEPFADSSAIATYCVSREARRLVTVALTGDGGDESLAGYRRYAMMQVADAYARVPAALREGLIARGVRALPESDGRRGRVSMAKRFVAGMQASPAERYLRWIAVFSPDAQRDLFSEAFLHETARFSTVSVLEPWFDQSNARGVVDSVLLADTMTYLPNDLLVKTDIASMAVSLEARSPFLDHHVLEFAAQLPGHFKLRRLALKHLLKRAVRTIVPIENIKRRKMGFGVPIRDWCRGPLEPLLRETLLSDAARVRGWFKPDAVRTMIDEHVGRRADHESRLWTLLMLELWCRRFID